MASDNLGILQAHHHHRIQPRRSDTATTASTTGTTATPRRLTTSGDPPPSHHFLPPRSSSVTGPVETTTTTTSTTAAAKTTDSVPTAKSSSATITRSRSYTVLTLPQQTSFRDSFASIVEDPFFQRFHDASASSGSTLYEFEPSPTTVVSAPPTSTWPSSTGNRHEPQPPPTPQRWPPPRRESLTIGNHAFWTQPQVKQPSPAMEGLNIAVVGAMGVGKSSFVQRVLGLSRLPISNASTAPIAVDNITYNVTLLELDLEYFDMSPSHPIQWPKQINGHIVPRVDGALILYDVMNRESIVELPQTLAALTSSGLPSVLVACKCDVPDESRQVDSKAMANHDLFKQCVATYTVSKNTPEAARLCLNAILRAAVANRKEGEVAEFNMSRRRAASAANLDAPDSANGRPLSQQSRHSRASSDLSLLRAFQQQQNYVDYYRGQSPRLPYMASPHSASSAFFGSGSEGGGGADDNIQTVSSMLRTPGGVRLDRTAHDSFLDIEESDAESYRYSDDIPILQRNDENFFERPAKVAGVTFDELVDRLLAPRMTKADNNFSDVFLCLYRKFAAPGELFSTILARLDRVRDDKTQHYLSKTATQLRIIEVVAKWVSTYPGDFARPATRRNLDEFIRHLSTEPVFSIAAQQMRRHLENNVIEDDDTCWAKSDEAGDKAASKILSKEHSSRSTEITSGISSLNLDDDTVVQSPRRPSTNSDYSHLDRNSSSVGSQFQFHSYEEYEAEAATMEPTDQLPMNKFRYHIFMDTPDDDLADEMTRIDWVMFSSIRIRDFVRHVSLPGDQKEKRKSLKNVNRMISHFNHVAKWVANMILLRDKAKHRAQMLEKFMNIALKLRQLNNYNGLAAVLAGINGSAIHRLSQTRALVSPEVQKRFARLVILMGTQKSHFAYRLAWENSPLPRIPFIPLHRRDLVSAEEGSRTLVGPNGDRINWKKFEILGEVLLPIMKSQGTPYPNLTRHDAARELILDCRMPTDDEEIYQRSLEVETSAGGASEPGKKKFPWFAKS